MAEKQQPSATNDRATPSRRPYDAPQLVKYGDIATLTQTGGLTKKDTGSKNQRIG